jgi:hypothetical protein
MARLLRAAGDVSCVDPQDAIAFSLTELRAYVGGPPHIVPYSSYSADILSTHVFIASEGQGAGDPAQPFNSTASILAGQSVYGNVVMLEVDALRRVRSVLSAEEWDALRGTRPSSDRRTLDNTASPETICERRPMEQMAYGAAAQRDDTALQA